MPRIVPKLGMRVVFDGHEATVIATARNYDAMDGTYPGPVKLEFDAWWLPARWVSSTDIYQIDSESAR